MDPIALALHALLEADLNLIAAYQTPNATHPSIELRHRVASPPRVRNLPNALQHHAIHARAAAPLRTLTAPVPHGVPQNLHQLCQDEPIELGTQIQPRGKPWVGTAGSPVSWRDADGLTRYGILSNWHVMAGDDGPLGIAQHQPTDNLPAIAHLYDAVPPQINTPNLIDLAIADAAIDGYHTIARTILGIGPIQPNGAPATPGTPAIKAGRTTAVTAGHCTAIGAAVRISYGTYEATFADQDLYEGDDGAMSAPGDSGSLILQRDTATPLGLLFAGSADLTVANPARYIQRFRQITWL